MDPADGFASFVSIVEHASISAAARALGLPRATLSRRLAALEEELGVRLMHRSTRNLRPTAAGDELYRRARRIVAEATEARVAVARLDGVPRGLLRLSTPPGFGPIISPVVVQFLDRWPEVQIEVQSGARHVDLVAEGIDLAIRAGRVADQSLVARRIWSTRLTALAAPSYLEARGTPTSPSDLAAHECIRGFERGEVPARSWPLLAGGEVAVTGRLVTSDLHLIMAATAAGRGLGLLPERPALAGLIAAGELVRVLPEQVGGQVELSLVYPSRELLDPKVRAFIDLAADAIREAVDRDPVSQPGGWPRWE